VFDLLQHLILTATGSSAAPTSLQQCGMAALLQALPLEVEFRLCAVPSAILENGSG
jgi:hypothetical protein